MKIENATIILHGGPIRMSHEELNAGAISNCQLFAAARRPITEAELQAQRDSWVHGELALGSDKDEAAHRRALAAGDKEAMERLDREAAERVARHDSGEG